METEINEIGSGLLNISIVEYSPPNRSDNSNESYTTVSQEHTASSGTFGESNIRANAVIVSESREDTKETAFKIKTEEGLSDTNEIACNEDIMDNNDSCSSSESSDGTLSSSSETKDFSKMLVTDYGGGGDAHLCCSYDDCSTSGITKVKIVPKGRPHEPEAYRKWVQLKNEELRRNREKKKNQEEQRDMQRRLEEDKRKKMNETKVQQWMQRKKHTKCKETNQTDAIQRCAKDFLQNNADTKYKVWLKRVKQQEEEKKTREIVQQQLDQKAREEKNVVSQVLYKQWLKSSKHKPLPVPLNQGPNSLRGTVSKMFVNPQPWKSNCD